MGGKGYFDFDRFWKERERKPKTIRVFGAEHILPPALPARVVLKVERYQEMEEGAEVPPSEIRDLAEAIFTRKRVAEWLDREDFDIEMLTDLFKGTLALYSDDQPEDDEGEAGAPTTGPSEISSITGDSSKPTSSASTGST